MRKTTTVGTWVLRAAVGIVLALLITKVILLMCGIKSYAVRTGSMEPDIHQGSLLYVKNIDASVALDVLAIDDDITYHTKNNVIVTHRIIAIDKTAGTITTKGIIDGAVADSAITPDQVIGITMGSIPVIGYLVLTLQNKYFIIALILVIILAFVIEKLVKELKHSSKQNAEVENKED